MWLVQYGCAVLSSHPASMLFRLPVSKPGVSFQQEDPHHRLECRCSLPLLHLSGYADMGENTVQSLTTRVPRFRANFVLNARPPEVEARFLVGID
jgi:hypothetical protein